MKHLNSKIGSQKISRCLISVSNKAGIVDLARFLEKQNIEIISTGGTHKLLNDSGIRVRDISDFTGFPEMMDGRLKTLHPKVHGGLLTIVDNPKHLEDALKNSIDQIDLLIVNLYPFIETLARTSDDEVIIENIDIGGPAMIRSAAKNFKYKTVITSTEQYKQLIDELERNNVATELKYREDLAREAFANIAEYDIAIANYFMSKSENSAEKIFISANLKQSLRYGENSHQKASLYSVGNSGIVNSYQVQGKELSYNNINDADSAYNIVLDFQDPACAIIKHANPCGVAVEKNLIQAFKNALESDPKSAFGGIVALNGEIDEHLARELSKIFFEVIIAKSITKSAEIILKEKKNLRILIADFKKNNDIQIKTINGGLLLQEKDNIVIEARDLMAVSTKKLEDDELKNLVFAINICKHVKSNAIVIVNNSSIVGIGAGQTSRVDACQIACKKAAEFNKDDKLVDMAKNGYMASDAFFPFADNIEIAAKYQIKAIVAPKGSIRDQEVIDAANKHKIALYFIESRHFKH